MGAKASCGMTGLRDRNGGRHDFYNVTATLSALAIGLALALLVYALIRTHLRALLDAPLEMPAGTAFYLRTLVIVLLAAPLTTLAAQQKPDAKLMEYVWAVATSISSVPDRIVWTLLIFVAFVTAFILILRFRRGQ
jgi:hypothetical protein